MVSVEERHVLDVLRRPDGDADAQVTGMSVRRALVILERLAEQRLLEIERLVCTTVVAVITDSGRIALDRAGGWPPHR